MAATTTPAAGSAEVAWKDRDPPPAFDGNEESFKQFLRNLELWRHETDIPKVKHGAKLLRQLTGAARAVADELTVTEITSESGVNSIVEKLKSYFQPHLETAMPRAFEKAVYGESRKNKESLGEYLIRMEASFRELATEGIALDEKVRGYILFRQANLSQVQEDQITTWTQGKYERGEIVKAFRKLEKVQKDKPSPKTYAVEEGAESSFLEDESDGNSDEYIYVGEGDLNEVLEESEVQEALSTYQQVRRAIKDQRVSRGYYPPKGGGRSNSSSPQRRSPGSFGKGGLPWAQRDPKSQRVHIDTIKLRTRCARCGCVGHWAKECTNEPDARGRQKQENMANKTGFCEVRSGEGDSNHDTFWGSNPQVRPTLGQFLPKRGSEFHGITTHREHAVVDTAAQGGLIGKPALMRLEHVLKEFGLKVRKMNKVAQARGIGGEAHVCGVVEIPIAVSGVNGVVEATVVEEDVPLLLSIRFLREVHAVVDIATGRLHLTKFGTSTCLHDLPSGHVAVNIVDFPEEGWSAPQEAVVQNRQTRDFLLPVSVAAMYATSFATINAPVEHSRDCHGSLQATRKDEARGGGSSAGGRGCEDGGATQAWGHQLDQSHQEGAGSDRPFRSTGEGRRLARRWIVLWIASSLFTRAAGLGECVQVSRQWNRGELQGESLQGVDCGGRPSRSSEVQATSPTGSEAVFTPCGEVDGKWESEPKRGVVHTMSPAMVGGSAGDDGFGKQEDRGESGRSGVEGQSQQGRDTDCRKEFHEDVEDSSGKPCSKSTEHSTQNTGLYECGHLPGNSTKDAWISKLAKGGSEMSMRPAGRETDGEEGQSNQREAFLQVSPKSVRFLPVGCQGGQGHPTTGEPSPDEAGCGGRSAGDPPPRDAASDPIDYGGSREEACADHGGSASGLSSTDGLYAQPAGVDDCSSWRGEAGRDHEQPPIAGGDEPQGHGVKEEPRADGESSSGQLRDRRQQHVRREEIEEIAPWACVLETKAQWERWRSLQRKGGDMRDYERLVAYGGWVQPHNGEWKEFSGTLPSYEPGSRAVGIFYDGGAWMDDDGYEEASRSLSRSSRKAIQRNLRQMVVSEVYSVPRVAEEAARLGHIAGGSFDKGTGYDFTSSQDRRRCWKELEEQDPDLLVLCPPCGPFSMLQELNYSKMQFSKAVMKVAEGVDHVNFAMQLFAWQHLRGKAALFEHPATSRAWAERSVQEIMEMDGVRRVRADQCQYGLQVKGIPNKKPTDFMVNGEHMAEMLSRRCQGGHEHQPLTEGRAALAQNYPRKLCQAMIRGAEKDSTAWRWCTWATEEDEREVREDDLEEGLEKEYEREEGSRLPEVSTMNREEEAEEPEEGAEERGVSREDKKLVQRLHNNLGHPRREEFCRALKMARARREVVSYVKKEFHCQQCEGSQRPSAARPACLPRTFEAGHTIGVDVVYFPGTSARENVPVLNITDWGTGYQTLEPLDNMQSEHVWMRFFRSWVRTFGLPQLLVMDQGREFVGPFARKATENGCLVKVIGARAPWQQGRTERHGGLAKEIFIKLLEEVGPVSSEEWKTCVFAVEAAKNRLYNRSGFSPAQRQIGANIRLPGTLASDDNLDPSLLVQSAGEEMRRMLQIRQVAMEAFVKHSAKAALQRAGHARSRVVKEFKLGETVYVYRVPLRRRGERENNKPKWVGPGSIIMIEGANVWISMRGELWKCAKEQVRRATSEEEQAAEMLKEEFNELKEQLARGSSKRSFQDITGWGVPPEEDDPPIAQGPPVRRRMNEAEGENANGPMEVQGVEGGEGSDSGDYVPTSPDDSGSSEPSSTTEEPEREAAQESRPLTNPILQGGVEAVRLNERLDDTMRGRNREDLYGPTRRHMRRMWGPYRGGVAIRPRGGRA